MSVGKPGELSPVAPLVPVKAGPTLDKALSVIHRLVIISTVLLPDRGVRGEGLVGDMRPSPECCV